MKKGTGLFTVEFALRTMKGEIEKWARAARKLGMNRSVWIRNVLNREAEAILNK